MNQAEFDNYLQTLVNSEKNIDSYRSKLISNIDFEFVQAFKFLDDN